MTEIEKRIEAVLDERHINGLICNYLIISKDIHTLMLRDLTLPCICFVDNIVRYRLLKVVIISDVLNYIDAA